MGHSVWSFPALFQPHVRPDTILPEWFKLIHHPQPARWVTERRFLVVTQRSQLQERTYRERKHFSMKNWDQISASHLDMCLTRAGNKKGLSHECPRNFMPNWINFWILFVSTVWRVFSSFFACFFYVKLIPGSTGNPIEKAVLKFFVMKLYAKAFFGGGFTIDFSAWSFMRKAYFEKRWS